MIFTLKVRAEGAIWTFTEENKQENKTTGAETNYLRPKEVRMEKRSVYIQKMGEGKNGWFNLIKCLDSDAERLVKFFEEQDPGCKFRIWTGREES